MTAASSHTASNWRRRFVSGLFLLVACALIARVAQLQYAQREFLQAQGESRQLRTVPIPAHRGMLLDRNGEPLAISTPVKSVWAEPRRALAAKERFGELARLLDSSAPALAQLLEQRQDRKFVYLRRQITPDQAQRFADLRMPGIHLQTEYRRYYPAGEAAAQLIGGTDIDDIGQEGLELAFDARLRGQPGARRVRKDRHGGIIADLNQIQAPKHGENVRLSIHRGLQYVAYRELERTVREHQAQSGSTVVLDVVTGEVLAMAQVPSFNPNGRRAVAPVRRRNRTVTDLYEPGSVIKPFTVLAALASGKYPADTRIDTAPGHWTLDRHTIRDIRNFGQLDLSGVLIKSSNVAAARMALDVPRQQLWRTFDSVGFGQALQTGFPGEAAGVLHDPGQWVRLDQASLGYGYGLSATPLHMAQAFMVLGNRGVRHALSFQAAPRTEGVRVLPHEVCDQVLRMLEHVARPGGTAWRAQLPGYTMAAKTGTVRKSIGGAYSEHHHVAMIAGLVPGRHPRLAMLVLVDEPQTGKYFGGEVAAPVFRRVAWEAVRLLNVPPDAHVSAAAGGSG